MPTLCFLIHGIGTQNQDYSVPMQEGIHRELRKVALEKQKTNSAKWTGVEPTSLVEFRPLYWANIGTSEQANLHRKLYPDLFGEASRFKRTWNSIMKFAPARSLSVNLLGDVFGYLGQFQEQIKRIVIAQIGEALNKALASKEPLSIVLVGHSLGTVILHDVIAGFLRYRYASFDVLVGRTSVFTMGSPLSLFSLVAERANPERFKRWVNFLHDRDPIAFPMERIFKGVQDVHVKKFYWNPLNQWHPLKLHALYWNSRCVHRRIAEEIAEHHDNNLGITGLPTLGPVPPEMFQPIMGGVNMAGLSQCFADFRDVPFKQLITTARKIDFCNIYGGAWLQTHAQYFALALQNPAVMVRACIISPDNPGLPGLSHHFEGKPVDELKRRIEDGTEELMKTMEEARRRSATVGRIQIYRSRNMVNHSFYRFDDQLFFAPRPLASAKHASTPIPCFAFRLTNEPGGGYEWVMRDFEELVKNPRDATLYFDSANQRPTSVVSAT